MQRFSRKTQRLGLLSEQIAKNFESIEIEIVNSLHFESNNKFLDILIKLEDS